MRPDRLAGRLEEWPPTCRSYSWRGTMQLFGTRVFEQQEETAGKIRGQAGKRLRAVAAVMLTLTAGVPSGFAQQAAEPAQSPDKTMADLPGAPAPNYTEPANMRPSLRG